MDKENFEDKIGKLEKIVAKLDALSPLKTLTRGYSIAEKDGKIINSVKDLNKEDKIELKFFDGTKDAQVL